MCKKIFAILLLLVTWSSANAQQFLVLGMGFNGANYRSEALDRFKTTYNATYAPYLASSLHGLNQAMGLSWELGYRQLNRLSYAALVGFQYHTAKDLARFQIGESRKLELRQSAFYLGAECGYAVGNVFVNGTALVFFNREITLTSRYSNPYDENVPNKSLNGTYLGESAYAMDLGLVVGIYRDPVILTVRVSYPIATAGRTHPLQDRSAEKMEQGTHIFPDDYHAYLARQPYAGVSSDLNGLKVTLMIAAALKH